MPRTTVSHSEVDSFLRCRRQHFYGYTMNLDPLQKGPSLVRGTYGHAALEVFFNHFLGDPVDYDNADALDSVRAYFIEQMTKFPQDASLIYEAMDAYQWFLKARRFQNWTVVAVEYEVIFDILQDTLEIPIVVDLIIDDPYGDRWVIDHKFMYDLMTPTADELQSQLPKYVAALRVQLGMQIDKTAYHVLRYRKLKENTVEARNQLLEVTLSDHRVQQTFQEHVLVATEVQRVKSLPLEEQSLNAFRVMNEQVCKTCSFRDLCVAELNDTQPDVVLSQYYTDRVRREFKK